MSPEQDKEQPPAQPEGTRKDPPGSRPPIRVWAQAHAFVTLGCLPLVLWTQETWPLAVAAATSFVGYIIRYREDWQIYRPLGGYANWVSLVRLIGVLVLGCAGLTMPPVAVGLIAAVMVTADGLDGYLAKKYQTACEFGAYLDMETDALYVCVLSLLAYGAGKLPALILIVGFLRYAYVAALVLLDISERPEPRRFSGRFFAVFITYSLAGVFLTPPILYIPAVTIGSLWIVFSFARSLHFQLRGDRHAQP